MLVERFQLGEHLLKHLVRLRFAALVVHLHLQLRVLAVQIHDVTHDLRMNALLVSHKLVPR